ncbi:MAG: hypothetical protein U0234_00595 [Sandaracinus sp.]
MSTFKLGNIADTCAVWNVLSSARLFAAACRLHCEFAVTQVVLYECLQKPRTRPHAHDDEMKERLRRQRESGRFPTVTLDLQDVQEVARLEARRRLGRGELASIAFAKRAGTAFCSDDRNAQKLGEEALGRHGVQTTPHLLGWLVFVGALVDADVVEVFAEHEAVGGPLRPHLGAAYEEGLRCRLLARAQSP